MSISLSVASKNYAVMMTDSRFVQYINNDYVPIDENFQKMFSLSENIYYSYTGNLIALIDCVELLQKYKQSHIDNYSFLNELSNYLKQYIKTHPIQITFIVNDDKNGFMIITMNNQSQFSPIIYDTTKAEFGKPFCQVTCTPSYGENVSIVVSNYLLKLGKCKNINETMELMKKCIMDVSDVNNTVNKNIKWGILT